VLPFYTCLDKCRNAFLQLLYGKGFDSHFWPQRRVTWPTDRPTDRQTYSIANFHLCKMRRLLRTATPQTGVSEKFQDVENTDLRNNRRKKKPVPLPLCPPQIPHWFGRGMNSGFHDEKPATDDLRHRTAISFTKRHQSYKNRKHHRDQSDHFKFSRTKRPNAFIHAVKNIIISVHLCVCVCVCVCDRSAWRSAPLPSRPLATPPNKQLGTWATDQFPDARCII
jgi:hypothetical protein